MVVASAFDGRQGVQSVEDQRKVLENLFDLLNGMTRVASWCWRSCSPSRCC